MAMLEKQQIDLLKIIVEAARTIPADKRDRFYFTKTESGESWIRHNALPNWTPDCYEGDLLILSQNGLLNLYYNRVRISGFDVRPEGFRHYENMKQEGNQPTQHVEDEIHLYLNSDQFKNSRKMAFEKWSIAETLLWKTDSEKQLTSVGHSCREAMQEFVESLVEQFKPSESPQSKTLTVNRLKAVIQSQRANISKTVVPFLNSLIDYWKTVDDLVQRQEHGAQKEGEPLTWEDARRIVFHTAIIMYEINKTLTLTPNKSDGADSSI